MKNIKSLCAWSALAGATALLWSCSTAGVDSPGSEYMPDMGHSIAYEANYDAYYYYNTWGSEEEYEHYAKARKPVEGTVARGYMPHAYTNLEDFRQSPEEPFAAIQDRVRALMMNDPEIVNPIQPANAEEVAQVVEQGKYLYTQHCEVCHGAKLDGNGVIYNEGEGKYSAKPANLVNADMQKGNDGQFLNAIIHGKGMMQSHSDKLSPMERWKVIHYIRAMQAKEQGVDYNPVAGGMPAAQDLTASFTSLMEQQQAGGGSADLKLELDNVLYSTGKADLKASSSATLNELVGILEQYSDIKIEISGHTDNTGDAAKNMQLSEDRAHSVYDYLVGKGIAADRLAYKGYGDTQPIASNETEDGQASNRRTEIKIVQ